MTSAQLGGPLYWTETFNYTNSGLQSSSPNHSVDWSRAKYPALSEFFARRETFFNWPREKDQTANELSQAGFFFAGTSDCTRCFYCGGGLRNWLPGDDPWVEHARWFPDCKFLQNREGKNFIESCKGDHPQTEQFTAPLPTLVTTSKLNPVDLVDSVLRKPCSASLIILGFSLSLVRNAVTKVLTESGWDEYKVTTTRLAEVAIEMTYETETWNSTPYGATTADGGNFPGGSTSLANQESLTISDGSSRNQTTASDIADIYEETSDSHNMYENTPDNYGAPHDTVSSIATSELYPDETANAKLEEIEGDLETLHLLEENERLRHQKTCKVCLDKEVSIVFLPCGHLVTCENCAPALNQCVICRQKIQAIVKAYV